MRRYIKQSRQCFIGYPNTSNFVKNTPLRIVFSTLWSVFGYPNETLSLVFDILRPPLPAVPTMKPPICFCRGYTLVPDPFCAKLSFLVCRFRLGTAKQSTMQSVRFDQTTNVAGDIQSIAITEICEHLTSGCQIALTKSADG